MTALDTVIALGTIWGVSALGALLLAKLDFWGRGMR